MELIFNKAHRSSQLHTDLALIGGSAGDYRLETGGYDPVTLTPRPDYLKISTDLAINAQQLTALVSDHNSLVLTGANTVSANGSDEIVVSCSAQSFNCEVWLGNELVLTKAITDGTIEFSTPLAGLYLLIARQGQKTGYHEVTAT